jgi:hypothetical protein
VAAHAHLMTGENILDIRILLGFLSHTLNAFLQIRGILVTSQNCHNAFAVHFSGEFRHYLMTTVVVIDAKRG